MKWWQWALLIVGIYFVWRWWSSYTAAGTTPLPYQNPSNPLFTYPYTYGGALATATPQGTDTTGIGYGALAPVGPLPFQPPFPGGVTDYGGSVPVLRPMPVGPARVVGPIY